MMAVPNCLNSYPNKIIGLPDAIVSCTIQSNLKKVLFACVYNAPCGSNYRLPEHELCRSIEMLSTFADTQNCNDIIISGDFNAPSINWNTLTSDIPYDTKFLQTLDKCMLTQHVKFKTTASNTLDLIFSKSGSIVLDIAATQDINKTYMVNGAPLF